MQLRFLINFQRKLAKYLLFKLKRAFRSVLRDEISFVKSTVLLEEKLKGLVPKGMISTVDWKSGRLRQISLKD